MITRRLSFLTGLSFIFAGVTQAIESVRTFNQMQSSGSELMQYTIIAVVVISVFWLLFTTVSARYGYGKSALQNWLGLLYVGAAIFFMGLHFGMRGDHPELGQLYDFIARTMFATCLLYMGVALPIALRRRDSGGSI